MGSTRANLPERLRWFHRTIKDNPLMAPFAPIVEAADEIDKLRELLARADAVSTWETTAEGRSFQDEIDQALNRVT